jgi:hypothetical protein
MTSATELYQQVQAEVSEVLADLGAEVILPRTADSVDPVTGTVVPGTDATTTTLGILIPYPDELIDGTRILASDRMLISDNGQEILVTDTPIIGGASGDKYSVVEPMIIEPDGQTLIVNISRLRK